MLIGEALSAVAEPTERRMHLSTKYADISGPMRKIEGWADADSAPEKVYASKVYRDFEVWVQDRNLTARSHAPTVVLQSYRGREDSSS